MFFDFFWLSPKNLPELGRFMIVHQRTDLCFTFSLVFVDLFCKQPEILILSSVTNLNHRNGKQKMAFCCSQATLLLWYHPAWHCLLSKQISQDHCPARRQIWQEEKKQTICDYSFKNVMEKTKSS